MTDIELTRARGDRSLYVLEGVGTLRRESLFFGRATAEAGGTTWRFSRHGLFGRTSEATDETGALVGEFVPRALRRGGALQWAGHPLTLRPASSWRERYALADGEHELALLDGRGWGRRPVRISLEEPAAIEPGLLLFTAFVVRGLADDANSSTGAGASTASMGAY